MTSLSDKINDTICKSCGSYNGTNVPTIHVKESIKKIIDRIDKESEDGCNPLEIIKEEMGDKLTK